MLEISRILDLLPGWKFTNYSTFYGEIRNLCHIKAITKEQAIFKFWTQYQVPQPQIEMLLRDVNLISLKNEMDEDYEKFNDMMVELLETSKVDLDRLENMLDRNSSELILINPI